MAIDIRRTEMTRAFASSERLQLVFIHIGSVCLSVFWGVMIPILCLLFFAMLGWEGAPFR